MKDAVIYGRVQRIILKLNLRHVVCEGVDWLYLICARGQWRDSVIRIMSLQVL